MNKRFFWFFPVFLFLAVGLSGRGGSEGKGKVTLNFMEVLTSPSRTKLMLELIEEYEQMNPGIDINLISPPYEQADNRLTLALASGEDLDVVEVREYAVNQLVNNGYLMSLEDFLSEWDEAKTLLPIALSSARSVDNTAYIIPEFFFTKALFVRRDVLASMGINEDQYPKTVDEFIQMSIDITDKARGQYGFGFRGRHGQFKITDYMTIFNNPDLKADNAYMTASGEFSFATDIARDYLERYVELYKNAVPEDGINWGFNEQVNAFVSGTTPFLIQDPDTLGLLADKLTDEQYTVIPLPVGPSGRTYLNYGFGALGITSSSENKEEAKDFLGFILSSDINARFNRSYGALPIHSSTYDNDDYFSVGVYKAWQTMIDENPGYRFITYPVSSPKWSGWGEFHTRTQQSLLLGQMSVDEVIEQWVEYWSE